MFGVVRNAATAFLCMLIAACGGGGGGGGPSTPPGSFNLSGTSATFASLQNAAAPAPVTLAMSITGSKVAYVGAAYTNGQTQPFWLGIDITGSGTSYSVAISIRSTNIQPGEYTSTFAVGTADSSGNVLRSQNITVNYSVSARIAISGAAQTHDFIYGDASMSRSQSVAVVAANRQWRLTSDSAWLQAPDTLQTNSGTLNVTVDTSSLLPGQYVGQLTATNATNAQDTASQMVTVNVAAPTLAVAQESIVLGGTDGRSATDQTLAFTLDTGAGVHPFSVELTTDSGGGWLRSSTISGSVSGTGASVSLSADRGNLPGGTYTGQVRVSATVRDLVLTEVLPVTLNIEASRIVTDAAGVSFSSSPQPARSVLTRNVRVLSSLDRTDVPWQASADQPWLTVTASGTTGGAIAISADPLGLAADTTHFATVTVTSPDPLVENVQSIRVGLHINSAAPVDLSNTMTARYITASPVEPIVFINDGGADVAAYNVYTGAVARTFSAVVAGAGAMVMSDDGRELYVFDRTNLRVTQIDATSGNVVRHYDSGPLNSTTPSGGGLAYFRPAGHRILVTPSSRMYDVDTGAVYASQQFVAPLFSMSLEPSREGRYLVTHWGGVYEATRSALNGGQLNVSDLFSTGTTQGREGQACIRADSEMVYTASGAPYEFPGVSFATRQVAQILPGTNYPNAILCLWNGVVIGGVDGYYASADVWIYDGLSGQELARRSSSTQTDYRSLVERGMAASADATRLVTLTRSSPGLNQAQEVRFQSIPGAP